tara:strand:- start:1138 stop:1740 length:603 start_codon:yes stop_codon:yes gene_type:complete
MQFEPVKSTPETVYVTLNQNPMRNWNVRFFDCLKTPCLSIYTAFGLLPCVLTQISGKVNVYPCFQNFKSFSLMMILLGTIYYSSCILNGLISNWGIQMGSEEETYNIYFANSYINYVLLTLFIVFTWKLRYEVRKKLNIFGDDPTDCLYSFFCPCCTVVQMANELNIDVKDVIKCKQPSVYMESPVQAIIVRDIEEGDAI